ncbi:uncharacterized protein LOC128879397 [Hylaeus volcanicus]|uniref:uncharacterized protein LOC128879397 n=1 Tax=Hylaeus volcanicus TaxID=313075 RepID=UPI0023B7DC3E|nr:uncharacterized protein LOC128879397 [Hylaeus volcanicus]
MKMSGELLPEWLNNFLDDVESTLCLPILLLMVFCTIQFIVNHTMDIGCTVYQNIKQTSDNEDEEDTDKEKGEDFMSKIKGFFYNLGFGNYNTTPNIEDESTVAPPLKPSTQEEEWDYCEEDDD